MLTSDVTALNALSYAERLVLQIICVAATGIEDQHIQLVIQTVAPPSFDCRPHVKALRQRGLLHHETWMGTRPAPHILELGVREAARAGLLPAMATALRRLIGRGSVYQHGVAERDARLAAYSGNFDEVRAIARRHNLNLVATLARTFGYPFDMEWFETLPADLQHETIINLLGVACLHFVPQAAAFAWFESHADVTAPGTAFYLGQQLIWRNRLDECRRMLAKVQGWWCDTLLGTLAVIDGDDAAAELHFKTGLLKYRERNGKRKGLLGDFTSIFYLLSLLRQGRYAEVRTLARSVAKGDEDWKAAALLADVAQHESGSEAPDPVQSWELTQKDRVTQFVYLLHAWWTAPADFDEALRDWLEIFKDEAQEAGFEFWRLQAEALQQRVAGVPPSGALVDLLRRSEPWERVLTGLEAVVQKLKPAEQGARLVWVLEYHSENRYELSAREQKPDAQGWNRGKSTGLKTLHEKAATMSSVTAQDRQIVAAIQRFGSAWHFDYPKALPALVGHPLVFDSDGRLVEIVGATPELSIVRHADKLRITLGPPSHGQPVRLLQDTPTRYKVVSFSADHLKLAELLHTGLEVPIGAADRLAHLGTAVSQILTVNSDLHLGIGATEVPWDRVLRATLLPWGLGLKAQFMVQPLGPEGPSFKPGQGGEMVVAEVGGRRVQTRRDLADERTRLDAFVAQSSVLRAGSIEWIVEDLQACLDLLCELEAAEDVEVQWPQGQKFKLVAHAGSQGLSMSVARSKDWFVLDGNVRIDSGRVVQMADLLRQVRNGRFVSLGGNEFLALTEEFRRRLLSLSHHVEDHRGALRFHALAAPCMEGLAEGLSGDASWDALLTRVKDLSTWAPAVPNTLQAELRPYQVEGYQWLSRLSAWGVGACLADDMGLGKTLQALAVIVERAPQGPTLVVAPASVGMNWVDEARRFAPTLNVRLYAAENRQEPLSDLQPFDLVVCTYGLLFQDQARLAAVTWQTIVLDEAQAIKNHGTRRSQAAKGLKGRFRLVTPGTPVENHLTELWNLFDFLNPGLLGSLDSFHRRFATPVTRSQDVEARTALRNLIAPFILRRTKAQVLTELPPRTELVLRVDLGESERAMYEAMRSEAVTRLMSTKDKDEERPFKILAELMRLRRACCHPRLVLPSAPLESSKLSAFGQMVDELLENRHKALVFSQFVDHLAIVRQYLDGRGISYQYLDGSTPIPARRRCVDAFQAGQGDLFLISLRAGGTGLNLTAADYVIHLDPWWNPAVEDQASDRAYRIGQMRPVTVYRLVTAGTIEEQIVSLHAEKRQLADALLEGSDVNARLSSEQLLELLSTRASHVE